ncbi:MAG: tyrosine-type recombinase/integrase [Chloroflexi bacterium]|nr:tyrosine-type recombinase/integrase [Chloroflexota bacterium]
MGRCAADDGWNYESLKTLHDLTAVMLLYESGCRAGELCNLSSHRLNKAFAQPAPAYSIVAYGKTNDRTYHVTESTVELYRLWYAKRPFSMTWAFCSWRRGGEPEKLSAPALGQMLARRCHQAGIRPFRPHSMRHAKVIRSRKLVGLELASRLADHANIQTTRAYDFIDDGEVGVAARLTGYSPQ